MKTFRTIVDVPAPPAAVWGLLADFTTWTRWNPSIPRIKGTPRIGGSLVLALIIPLLPLRFPIPTRVRLLAFDPGRELRWKGGVPGLITGEHGWRLEPTPTGTRVVHEESFRGILVPLLARRMNRTLPPAYDGMNTGLLQSFSPRRVETV